MIREAIPLRWSGWWAIGVLGVYLLAGCQAPPKIPTPPIGPPTAETALKRLEPDTYPNFSDDLNYESLERALAQSIAYLEAAPPERMFRFGPDPYNAQHVLKSLQRFQTFIRTQPPPRTLQEFIRNDFRVYRSIGRDAQGQVLYTGYYEPLLRGSLERRPGFHHPVYPRPDDLVTIDLGAFFEKYKGETIAGRLAERRVVPYYERREIEQDGVLYGKVEPIAWVEDPLDLFFLHIQGSGRIALEDGRTLHVNYAAKNGRPYRSIGQLLIDEGRIPRDAMSMQRIKAYLRENPSELQRVLNHNPSFIFFRIVPDGPLGALNVTLTPGRSLALDLKMFPPAALAFIETSKPAGDASDPVQAWLPCHRFALNQDTGGAITGPGRADIFWGSGPYAELAAGHLKHPGTLYFIVLKPEAASP
jgi:membrane-bound lytic murein transglycosylase A